jgi:proteasome regulatory subunit
MKDKRPKPSKEEGKGEDDEVPLTDNIVPDHIDDELEDDEEVTWWSTTSDRTTKDWIKDEVEKAQWDSEDNPWKREAVRSNEEKRYLENEVMRLQNKVMLLNGELNRLKSPPLIVGTIVDFHSDEHIVVSTSGGPSFVVKVLSSVEKDELEIGTKVSMNKDTMTITGILPSSKDPLVGSAEIDDRPETSFKDIGGLDEQIIELKEVVELPLIKPELFEAVGIEPPKGVLLIGPPGCGKTLLAKAIAHETNATFLRMVGSELVQKYIGEGSRMVRELFALAREKGPTILFLDELDSIAGRRTDSSTSADREVHRTLIQLLAELDGFNPLGKVRIIAATNRPDILDSAILRPGRLDRIIEIPMPDQKSRIEIYKVHTKNMSLDESVQIEELASMTDNFNGAQIKAVCTEAGMFAIRSERKKVNMDDFRSSIKKLKETSSDDTILQFRSSPMRKEGYSMFV